MRDMIRTLAWGAVLAAATATGAMAQNYYPNDGYGTNFGNGGGGFYSDGPGYYGRHGRYVGNYDYACRYRPRRPTPPPTVITTITATITATAPRNRAAGDPAAGPPMIADMTAPTITAIGAADLPDQALCGAVAVAAARALSRQDGAPT